jgi:DNA mismatch repair protein MutS2
LNPKTLNILEYPKVLQKLAAYTSFSAGRELALALEPSSDIDEVRTRMDVTTEAVRLLQLKSDITLGGAHDIRDLVRQAEVGGAIPALAFLDLESTLVSSRTLRAAIVRLAESHEGELPTISETARQLANLPMLEQAITRTIAPNGEVLDTASPALATIRASIKTAYNRLMDKLNSLLYSQSYANALQEPIITIRNGRYVVPVKADMKKTVRGIVHDQSGSGATVFMEPLETVELNNTWRQLQLDEQEEIERILRALSGQVANYNIELRQTVTALAELDLALAKAKYSLDTDAHAPRLLPASEAATFNAKSARNGERGLLFKAARHPLLTGKVVPITIELGDSFRVLVITGPNTGGKTVALKTTGLLSLMAQAGLHIPADEGSVALVFPQIFADIGDEQSIEQSLSTFSSHLGNIVNILRDAQPGALILLDELGAGTDPTEGAALARSIIADLLKRGVLAVGTTHYSELKSFAYNTEGVENASVEFNVETLSPTYRLTIGLPGRSNALAIARRLGLPQEIIEAAQELVSPAAAEVESLLAGIRLEREQAASARLDAQQKAREVAQLQRDLRRQLREIDRLKQQAIEEARANAGAELDALRIRLRQAGSSIDTAASRQALTDAQRQLDEAGRQLRSGAGAQGRNGKSTNAATALAEAQTGVELPPEPATRRSQSAVAQATAAVTAPQTARPLASGDRVYIESLESEGEALGSADPDGEVEVSLGAFKMRIPERELQRIVGKAEPAGGSVTYDIAATSRNNPAPSIEIDMRGWRAEEVAPRLERYLNDASVVAMPFVRIIHGKGTGVLRQVVREILANSPLVTSYASADIREGGDGVTIARLN